MRHREFLPLEIDYKIVTVKSWREIVRPREWVATYSCGHESHEDWDDSFYSDDSKARIEKEGKAHCYKCGRTGKRT